MAAGPGMTAVGVWAGAAGAGVTPPVAAGAWVKAVGVIAVGVSAAFLLLRMSVDPRQAGF